MNGILNVLKPPGMTSSDVVVYLRNNLKIRKAGHTGTLDPEAAGVLLVCLGKATRISDYIMRGTKIYRCGMKLGITTDTDDITGRICSRSDNIPDLDRIHQALEAFQGELEQIPPMYSAIKVRGKKLYELARQGIEIERKPRKVEIFKNEFLDFFPPDTVLFETECSKGTYIRSLCRDIGKLLGCGAVMSFLIRIASSNFHISQSYTLDEILEAFKKEKLDNMLVSMEEALKPVLPSVVLDEACKERISNGNKVGVESALTPVDNIIPGQHCSIFCGKDFIGIGYVSNYGNKKEIKMKSVLV